MIALDSWFMTLLIALAVYYLIDYVKKIKSYPRGPFPLPIVGSLLLFRGPYSDPPPVFTFIEWPKKYGPIFTIWAGPTPFIVVNNYELNYEASIVKRNDYIDRPDSPMNNMFKAGNESIFASSGPVWEALRKVGFSAARKFAISERLSVMINEVVDETVQMMLKENKSMNPTLFIDFMIYNILAYTAYGEKFSSMEDKEYLSSKRVIEEFYEVAGDGLISEYIPWLRPFYHRKEKKMFQITKASVEVTKKNVMRHKNDFTPGIIRDFSDCVLEAKEEALKEDSLSAKYLTDNNIVMIVSDLFLAGNDTSRTTIKWALLILANDPKLQQKIYDEIINNIGDRNPIQEDKKVLPFTYAFLQEVLRFRPPAPVGGDHVNTFDTELGGYKIPKNTRIVFNLYAQNNDPKYWDNPQKFDPNRFLDKNGNLLTGRVPSYVTFGLGRRGCLGEKLALNNNFLMITRLMQNMRIELSTGSYTADLVPMNILQALIPKDYEIKCFARE